MYFCSIQKSTNNDKTILSACLPRYACPSRYCNQCYTPVSYARQSYSSLSGFDSFKRSSYSELERGLEGNDSHRWSNLWPKPSALWRICGFPFRFCFLLCWKKRSTVAPYWRSWPFCCQCHSYGPYSFCHRPFWSCTSFTWWDWPRKTLSWTAYCLLQPAERT